VYAGAATGGVFKSTDLGNTWFPVFDEQAVLPVGDIAVDPTDGNILYVGTGEANGGHNNFAGAGVYKTTDGGFTWTSAGLEATVSIGRILIDPLNPQRVFVAAVGSYFGPQPERGVYRSTDGGVTWEQSLFVSDSTGAIDLAMHPSNPLILYAAMWERVRRPESSHLFGPTSGVYRSTDGGDTWHELTNGLPDAALTDIGRIGLALSPTSPSVVYALFTDGYNYAGTFKTTNGGDSWLNADPDFEASGGFFGFSWYFGQIRVHPSDPNHIWILDGELIRSTNGGASFTMQVPFHVDYHALAYHPRNPSILFAGNDGGIDVSMNGGTYWVEVPSLPITQFYEIGLDFLNPQRLYGGTQDNGTVRTLTGAFDDWVDIYGGDGFYVSVDPTNSNVIYAESQYGFLGRSDNGGTSWVFIFDGNGDPTNWSTPVVMDPTDHLTLYYGSNRVWRTTNAGNTWTVLSGDLTGGTPRLNTITTIAVAPNNSAVIYAGTADGRVWVSTNGGTSWINRTSGLPYRWVTRVAVDPGRPEVAYVTFSGLKWRDPQPHIFRTTDTGAGWMDISSNLPDAPINGLAVDPNRPNVLFVGSDVGAYFSQDTGATWNVLGNNLPMVSVYDLKIHSTEDFLVAGTHGRSMYKINLEQVVDVRDGVRVPTALKLEQNYPNPFNPSTTIRYELSFGSKISLKVYNLLGQEVRTLFSGNRPAGVHSVSWDGRDNQGRSVASGVYVYRLEGRASSETRKMVLAR
jgi:photosystem II stability/assembly factor-like uncharacterized protein